jgi:FtsH-binding integral membrane protein
VIVPPYVPDAIEVDGNVASQRHRVRLRFVRKVVSYHFASVLLLAALVASPMPALPIAGSVTLLFFSLLVLSITRQITRPRPIDQLYSVVLSPVLLISLAMTLKALLAIGVPVWAPALGLICGVVYTYASGRDFSFLWLYITSCVFGIAAAIAVLFWSSSAPLALWEASLGTAAYMLYFVYDLACLQSRRRPSEVLGAVVDLYRDVLNVFTYSIRVVRHWRRHRIWST